MTPLENLQSQIWEMTDGREVVRRTGIDMARRFTERGNFKTLLKAVTFFNETKTGDVYNTGVSSYIRIDMSHAVIAKAEGGAK